MIRITQLIYGMILLVIFSSCQKNKVDLIFGETPEIRMNQKIDSITTALISAPNGWKAYVGTNLKGGYGFYFEFDEQQVVKMVADLTDESSLKLAESNYRVKQDNGATLIFDTYNYISMLNDPNPNVYNGTVREGLRSDLEFRFGRSSEDSIIFIGKRYGNELVLVKASKQESDIYKSNTYNERINKTRSFFVDNQNPYIEIASQGHTYQVAISTSHNNKIIEFASMTSDGKATSAANGKFAYSLNGYDIVKGGVSYLDITITKADFEGDKLFFVDSEGKKYEVKNSPIPILPLYKLIGSKYAGFRSPYLTYFPGTSNDGLTILKRYHEGLASGATGYVFNHGYLDLGFDVLNKRVTLNGFASQNGGTSGWITTIVYNYTLDDETGIYTLTLRDRASGGYTSAILNQMDSFLQNSSFKFDFFVDGGNVYGQLIGVDQPNVVITFLLR